MKQTTSESQRSGGIKVVLWQILVLNIVVAVAKAAWGLISGSTAMFADGIHSLTDASSNVVALVAMAAAGKPIDESHPYGHQAAGGMEDPKGMGIQVGIQGVFSGTGAIPSPVPVIGAGGNGGFLGLLQLYQSVSNTEYNIRQLSEQLERLRHAMTAP